MTLQLTKGSTIQLSKEAPGLKKLMLGAGWDVTGGEADLDLMVFATKGGKCRTDADLVYFGNLETKSMKHSGDNLTGAGDGDDETITIDLDKVDADVDTLDVVVTFYDANGRNFSAVSNASVRAVNADNDKEIAKFDVSGTSGTKLLFAQVVRGANGWDFKAVGNFGPENFKKGEVTAQYGI